MRHNIYSEPPCLIEYSHYKPFTQVGVYYWEISPDVETENELKVGVSTSADFPGTTVIILSGILRSREWVRILRIRTAQALKQFSRH